MPALERYALRIGLLGCVLLLAGLYLGGLLGLTLGLGGSVLLVLAAYSPDHGLLLLGPFTLRELQLVTRKPTVFILRVLILAFALFAFLWLFVIETRNGSAIPRHRVTEFAEMLFGMLAGITAIVCGCYAAWALPTVISEEREAKRLEHLLVTDLRNREILTGKLAGRLVVLLGYAILLVPVMAFLTLLGGVEPRFVLTVAVLFVAGLLGISGVAIACSSVTRRPATAIVSSLLLVGIHQSATYSAGWNSQFGHVPSADVQQLLRAIGMGSVGFMTEQLGAAVRTNTLDEEVPRILRHFIAGQLLVLIGGWLFGMRFLRNDGRRDGGNLVRRAVALAKVPPPRAPVGNDPVLWQELTSGSFFLERWARRLLAGHMWLVLVIAFFASLGQFYFLRQSGVYVREGELQVSFSAAIAFFVLCIPVAWSASRCIVRERQLDTLDALLLTEVEPDEIVTRKWIGAVLSVRYIYGCFVLYWLAAVVLQHISIFGFLFLVATTTGAMMATAALGVLASVTSKTALRAFGRLFFGYFIWNGGLLTCGGCCLYAGRGMGSGGEVLAVIAGAILPPAAQVVSVFIGNSVNGREHVYLIMTVLLHLALLALVTFLPLQAAKDHFYRQTRPTKLRDHS